MEASLDTGELYKRLVYVYSVYGNNLNYARSKYPPSAKGDIDLREALFGMPGNVLTTCQLVAQHFEVNLLNLDYWKAYAQGDANQIPLILQEYDKMWRQSGFIFFLSKIEWIFRNMLMLIKPEANKNGLGNFKNIYSTLLAEIGLSSEEDVLDIARHLRNSSVHNNSYYWSKDGSNSPIYNYRGKKIQFIHGSNKHLATSIMFYLLEDLILLCRKIIDSPKISAFPRMDFVIK